MTAQPQRQPTVQKREQPATAPQTQPRLRRTLVRPKALSEKTYGEKYFRMMRDTEFDALSRAEALALHAHWSAYRKKMPLWKKLLDFAQPLLSGIAFFVGLFPIGIGLMVAFALVKIAPKTSERIADFVFGFRGPPASLHTQLKRLDNAAFHKMLQDGRDKAAADTARRAELQTRLTTVLENALAENEARSGDAETIAAPDALRAIAERNNNEARAVLQEIEAIVKELMPPKTAPTP